MSVKYSVQKIETDKDSHFTTALAVRAMDRESIDFPSHWATCQIQKCMITGINVVVNGHTGSALDLDVLLFSSGEYDDTSDIDTDSLIQLVRFDAADAYEINTTTGTWYYDTQTAQGMPIDYVDDDGTSKFHIGVLNRSAAETYSTATDTMKITITAEPMI